METSAKDATNVEVAFERVLDEIYKITARNAVKEPKPMVAELRKGRKLDATDDEDGVAPQSERVRLDGKKTGKKDKTGCC